MDTKEKNFERDIEAFLISPAGGYTQFVGEAMDAPSGTSIWLHNKQHDVKRCIYLDVLVDFIAKTQPKEWAKYVSYYGDKAPEKLYARFDKMVADNGLLYVLRNGIVDLGITLKLCYFKPESTLNDEDWARYNANILGCTRQFRYSPTSTNTIDMVLSLNGIPVVALELKNQLTGQDYECAIKQYKYDRSSHEFAFRFNNRFLVYFAVDLYQAWMTTQLKDEQTYFMPFNQGSNGAGVNGGAGNPANPNGYATAYLWEEVLQRDSLLDLIHRFITLVKEKKEVVVNGKTKNEINTFLMFPRYHQYDVVKKVLADVKENGAGHNYLIQHSAGSGKSNSIAWLAYRLASVHDADDKGIFNSVIVVTNRIVLDSQLQDTINSFDHQAGLVEAIDDKKNSGDLATALNNNKRIIICTVQKFLFAYKEIEKFTGKHFAVIIDEAHQGQNGESAKILHLALIDYQKTLEEYAAEEGIDVSEVDVSDVYVKAILGQGHHDNQSFFAFTATPKGETLEIFGTKQPDGTTTPFHVYSMRQAIEEGYILDVLQNYTTIKEAFKLTKITPENPEMVEGATAKALFKYYKQHGYTIAQKTEMIMENFLSNGCYAIGGKGKAMVVADSRANAVRYFLAIKKYIETHEEAKGCGVMVAFSDEVTLPESPNDQPYSEANMNLDENGKYITTDKQFRKAFHSSKFNILVVANKYQTGFDEPLLHSMYVDKKLKDVAAVQTLSRLNRVTKDKLNTFVMDFENTVDDIKNAFLPYCEVTVLASELDPNAVYDYRAKIAEYMLYNADDVHVYNAFINKQSKKQDPTAMGQLASMMQPVIKCFKELDEEERYKVRKLLKLFCNSYSYVTQIIQLKDKELFEEFIFVSHLVRLLPGEKADLIDIDGKIKLEYAKLEETYKGAITLDEKPPLIELVNPQPKQGTKKKSPLETIIEKVNEKFGGNFTEGDKVIITGIYNMFMEDKEVKKYQQLAKGNSTEMFVNSLFPEKFKEIVTQCFLNNNESFQKLFNDQDFYAKVQEAMAKELYRSLRK